MLEHISFGGPENLTALAFNSLFEMPTGAITLADAMYALSILYLRCTLAKLAGLLASIAAAFNSLFEMLEVEPAMKELSKTFQFSI